MLAARETYRLRNSSLGNYEIHKLKWSRLNSEKKKLLLRLMCYTITALHSVADIRHLHEKTQTLKLKKISKVQKSQFL